MAKVELDGLVLQLRYNGRCTYNPSNSPRKHQYVVSYHYEEYSKVIDRDNIELYLKELIYYSKLIVHSGELPHAEHPEYFENCDVTIDVSSGDIPNILIDYNFESESQAEEFARLFEIDEIYNANEQEIIFLDDEQY